MELKKSYKGFVLFMLGYVAVMICLCFLPLEDGELLTRLILMEAVCGVALLTWIIWRTEYVYWYNGTTYEDAVAAGSERRKTFARRHFERFAWCAAGCVACSLLAHALGWPFWIDICVFGVSVVWTAVSTIRIKL